MERRSLIAFPLLASLVIAVIVVVVVIAGNRSDRPSRPAAATTIESVPLHRQLVGTWQLEGIDTNAATYRDRPVVRFDDDGTWLGSDGCNGQGGTWRVSGDGAFVAVPGAQTLIGCHNVDYGAILYGAGRAEIVAGRLVLHARYSGAASTLVRDPLAMPDAPAPGWLPGYSFFRADRVVTDQKLIDQFAALRVGGNGPTATGGAGERLAPPVAWYLGRVAGHGYFLVAYHSTAICMLSFAVQNERLAAVGCRSREHLLDPLEPLGDGSAFVVADAVRSVVARSGNAPREFEIRDNVAIGGPGEDVTVTLTDGRSKRLTSSGLEVVPSDP